MSGSGEDAAPLDTTLMLEIVAGGKPEAVRRVVERAADRLMESLLAAPDVEDPSILLSVHPNDWDEPEVIEIGQSGSDARVVSGVPLTGGDE